jgi:hypothetical protein
VAGPTGPGWVVEMSGYHYHNEDHHKPEESAQFVRSTIVKGLLGEGKKVAVAAGPLAGADLEIIGYADGEGLMAATKEAIRYSQALLEGYQSLKERPLTTGTAEKICSTIKGVTMSVRRVPGTTLANNRTKEVIYTPPVGEAHIRSLLGNWEKFLHGNRELDPLIRMAVMHYQFEAIHPFTDGNGRTGRVINLLYLVEQGLLGIPVLYLSRHILRNKVDYYSGLQSIKQTGAWEPWLLYMINGVTQTARWTMHKILAVRGLLEETTERMRRDASPIYSRELAELVFVRPYCRITHVVESGLAKRQTASVYLKQLAAIGILREHKIGREKIFLNPAFIDLLTRD